jgi:hypothetical protein
MTSQGEARWHESSDNLGGGRGRYGFEYFGMEEQTVWKHVVIRVAQRG